VTDYDAATLERLPLAHAALRVLHFALEADALDDLFERHRGRGYEHHLSFSTLVHLLRDALLSPTDSARQTFEAAVADERSPVSEAALYGKLARIPTAVSQALLAEATPRMQTLSAASVDPLPPSLQRHVVLAFDGKKLKHVKKRLKPLRDLWGQLSGGRLLVVQDVATRMALAFAAAEDGEEAEANLVEGAVQQVRARDGVRPRLWLGDRLFANLVQMERLTQSGEQFLLRYQSRTTFHAVAMAERRGVTTEGCVWREEWGWLGHPSDPRRRLVRRVHLERPDAEPLVLITSLLNAQRYPAVDLLEAYRRRWGIETLFQDATQVFGLKHLIGTTPRAMILQASLVFLMANGVRVLLGHLAATTRRPVRSISTQLVFRAIVKELMAWAVLSEGVPDWATRDVETLRAELIRKMESAWVDRWVKQPTVKRPQKPPRTQELKGGYSSVYRVLRGEHQLVNPKPKPPRC
jgi:hypothetical protein